MSVQSADLTPWEWLADAHAVALEALRSDDAAWQAAALADLDDAKDAVGMLGCLFVSLALERGGLLLQRKLGRVFGGLGVAAFDKAQAAVRRAQRALDEMDALKARIRELEKQVDRMAAAREFGRTA